MKVTVPNHTESQHRQSDSPWKPGLVTQAGDSSTWEAEVGGLTWATWTLSQDKTKRDEGQSLAAEQP